MLQELAPVARSWQSKKHQLMAPISGQVFSVASLAANFSVHPMTGVDKLHEAGIFGKGAKVAVVDTGVWYPHPAVRDLHSCSDRIETDIQTAWRRIWSWL